ncbi:MAG: hypothetical protein ACFB8W_25095, partial [Elainellaceae cyanobacterium]
RPNDPAESADPLRGRRVRFVFQPVRSSRDGIVFHWLVHTVKDGKEKVAAAAHAYWMPFVFRDSGFYTEAELRGLAQQSIWELEEHIQYIRESFGLTLPVPPAAALPNPEDFPGSEDISTALENNVTEPTDSSNGVRAIQQLKIKDVSSIPSNTVEDNFSSEFKDAL